MLVESVTGTIHQCQFLSAADHRAQSCPGLNILNILHISHLHPRRWQCWHPNTGASALCHNLVAPPPISPIFPICANFCTLCADVSTLCALKKKRRCRQGYREQWRNGVHFLVDVLFINMVYGWSNLQYFFIDEILVHNIFRGSPSYPCCYSSWLGATKSDIGVRRSQESGPGSSARVFKYQLAAARPPAASLHTFE